MKKRSPISRFWSLSRRDANDGLKAGLATLAAALRFFACGAANAAGPAEKAPVPCDLKARNVTTNSFLASWSADGSVECFLFDCWSLSAAPWTGEEKWKETFSPCVNASKRSKRLTEETFDLYTDHAGWSGDFAYAPAGGNGAIQVNKASGSVGWLVSPELPAMESVELVVRAKAFASQPDRSMPVFLIRDGETNAVASFELTTSYADCHCAIPSVSAGDRLAFRSFSVGSQRRVLIDEISLAENFASGHAVTNSVCKGAIVEYSGDPGIVVKDLDAGKEYQFSVRAVVGGTPSASSEVCTVVTKSTNDILNAVAISKLPRNGGINIWHEDFGTFTNVYTSSSNLARWQNCSTIPYWQAYYGDATLTEITRNNGAGTQKGLYAYWATNKLTSTYSLGTMTSGTADELAYGLAFKNDTAFAIRKIAIGYDGMQFGFKNAGTQELAFEYLVTNELVSVAAEGIWTECANLTYRTTKDKESGLASGKDFPATTALSSDIAGATIPKDCYFIMRWRRSPTTYAAAMAVDNVTVAFTVQARPMTIVVR